MNLIKFVVLFLAIFVLIGLLDTVLVLARKNKLCRTVRKKGKEPVCISKGSRKKSDLIDRACLRRGYKKEGKCEKSGGKCQMTQTGRKSRCLCDYDDTLHGR